MKEKKSQRKLNLYFSKFVICHHQSGTLMYLKNYQKNGKKCIQNSLNQLKLVFKACVSGLSICYPKIIHMLNIFSLAFFSSVSIFTFAFFYDNFFFLQLGVCDCKKQRWKPCGVVWFQTMLHSSIKYVVDAGCDAIGIRDFMFKLWISSFLPAIAW